MVLGVKLAEAEPAKLEFAFSTLHELAAFSSDDHDFTGGTHLREEDLVEVTVSVIVIEFIHQHEKD